MKKLLFLGDAVGTPGRKTLVRELPEIVRSLDVEWVVVNGENSAGGSGITKEIALELAAAGANAVTLGDHVWDQKGFPNDIVSIPGICRPANLPPQCPGKTHLILQGTDGSRLLVFTVLGRQFMRQHVECPFSTADRLLTELKGQYDYSFVEIHAEVTSEKIGMGWFLDGRASLVVGTHTHVATADARVLPHGTAYQTDAGMCGPHEGVIGREKDAVLGAFLDGMPRRFAIAENDVRLNGVLASFDATGLATAVERFEWREPAGSKTEVPA